jgi:hypothetical protein
MTRALVISLFQVKTAGPVQETKPVNTTKLQALLLTAQQHLTMPLGSLMLAGLTI